MKKTGIASKLSAAKLSVTDNVFNISIPRSIYRYIKFFTFFSSDIFVIAFSLYISFYLRLELFSLKGLFGSFISALPFFIAVKLSCFAFFSLYKFSWRFVDIPDLWNIVKAIVVSEILLFAIITSLGRFYKLSDVFVLGGIAGFPRSVFISDLIVSLFLISCIRFARRFIPEIIKRKKSKKSGLRTIIIGTNNIGRMILKDTAGGNGSGFSPVCFLDSDIRNVGNYINGLRVLGTLKELEATIKKYSIEAVIIAEPYLDHKAIRAIYDKAKKTGVDTIRITPRIYDYHKPGIHVKDLEDIKIEDLIGRQAVKVNLDEMERFVKNKTVLITGGGGSIGSEITMQVCGFEPAVVVLLDIDETALHKMGSKIKEAFPHIGKIKTQFVVANVTDEKRIRDILEKYEPHIIFHAAAYKHVPVMEENCIEAVKVNIFGTKIVAEAAVETGVENFVMISTDKAVNPTSIMGATKRMAENICKSFNNCSETNFVSVRFGNVLGSRGSILPIFMRQLKSGGPLTVTHRDMERYFMTIPEAVSLVLQASVIGNGGEVMVLDMGKPVKIVTLAEDFIRINGLEPYKDIEIDFTGIRPGEKLFEETLSAEDGTVATSHDKIFVAINHNSFDLKTLNTILDRFYSCLSETYYKSDISIRELLRTYVKHHGSDEVSVASKENEDVCRDIISMKFAVNSYQFSGI